MGSVKKPELLAPAGNFENGITLLLPGRVSARFIAA